MNHPLPPTTSRLRWVRSVALVAVAALAVGYGVHRFTSRDDDAALTLVAHFKDASPLLTGNDVRMDGVRVGTVADLEQTPDGADVTLDLDPTALPVHRDARVTIKPVSLLGERYVDLDPGSPDQPALADDAQLPTSQTGSSTDLDQVLDSLDDPTSTALAALVAGLGEGMDHNGQNAADALKALAPAMQHSGRLADVLSGQLRTIDSLVTAMEKVAGGFATGEGTQLDRLVASSERLTRTTAVNEAAFRSMLADLPSTLRTARSTLAQLEQTADRTTPLLSDLRPTTDQLTEMSGEINDFADAADPALQALDPVLERADDLIRQAQPVAELLRQQGQATQTDARALDRLTSVLAPKFTTVMEFFKGWALATNSTDGLAHYFRAGLVLTPYSVTGLLPGTANSPVKSGPTKKGGKHHPVKDLLDSITGGITGALPDLVGGLLSPKTSRDGGVTGLNSDQEFRALDFLLGGN